MVTLIWDLVTLISPGNLVFGGVSYLPGRSRPCRRVYTPGTDAGGKAQGRGVYSPSISGYPNQGPEFHQVLLLTLSYPNPKATLSMTLTVLTGLGLGYPNPRPNLD